MPDASLTIESMPEETTQVVVARSVSRARQKSTRPRLSLEAERRFDDIERRSAMCYSELELTSHKFRRLAAAIRSTPDQAVPDPLPQEEDDTSALKIDELRDKSRAP